MARPGQRAALPGNLRCPSAGGPGPERDPNAFRWASVQYGWTWSWRIFMTPSDLVADLVGASRDVAPGRLLPLISDDAAQRYRRALQESAG